MFVSLTALGFGFLALDESTPAGGGPSMTGIITLVCLVVFIASIVFSLGPVTWTMIAAVFPNRVRGRGVSVETKRRRLEDIEAAFTAHAGRVRRSRPTP